MNNIHALLISYKKKRKKKYNKTTISVKERKTEKK